MINITRLLADNPDVSEILNPISAKNKKGPVAVFNLTRKCNLNCRHCYARAKATYSGKELSLKEIKKAIGVLKKIKSPVVLLSGGEPLMHEHIFGIIRYAKAKALRVALSTNGTLIDEKAAKELKTCGIDYVGISIDGERKFHDAFRNLGGAFDRSLNGLKNCRDAGIKTGIRFTLTRMNAAQLPAVLELCEREKIPRFCLYHLVYAGRGKEIIKSDVNNAGRRKIINYLIRKALEFEKKKVDIEILTVDNHSDGVYIYNYLKYKDKEKAEKALKLLKLHGGCSAGNKVLAVSSKGKVFVCQFWMRNPLGYIGQKNFIRLWGERKNKLLCRLGDKKQYLRGRCGRCDFNAYCGGCRVRAYARYGDFWQEDPKCYLKSKELKI